LFSLSFEVEMAEKQEYLRENNLLNNFFLCKYSSPFHHVTVQCLLDRSFSVKLHAYHEELFFDTQKSLIKKEKREIEPKYRTRKAGLTYE